MVASYEAAAGVEEEETSSGSGSGSSAAPLPLFDYPRAMAADNGQRGVAADFHYYEEDQSKDRYTVQLDSGEAFKLAHVRAAGARAAEASEEKIL